MNELTKTRTMREYEPLHHDVVVVGFGLDPVEPSPLAFYQRHTQLLAHEHTIR